MSLPKWLGKLVALMTDAGADPEKVKEIEAEFAAETPEVIPPVDAEAREQVKALQAALETERQKRLDGEAAAFAASVIQQRKALPAETNALRRQYLQAATDDAQHGGEVTFGQDQKGTRTDALRADIALRPAHQLHTELAGAPPPEGSYVVFNKQETEQNGAEKPPDEARMAELLSKSPLGQTVAKNGKGA